jgi:inner membrane protein
MATVPFGICLLIAARFRKENRLRAVWNWLGLAWFCGYLCIYTLWHKTRVNHLFEATLQAKNIQYQRYYTNPTIFNNIVWAAVAEGDTAYYFAQFGFNDDKPEFGRISTIPKNHQLLDPLPPDSRAGYFLRWFTEGYYNVLPYHGDTLQVNDLRFGLMGDTLHNGNYIFPFLVFKNDRGEWDIQQNNRNQQSLQDSKRSFGELWERIKGRPGTR